MLDFGQLVREAAELATREARSAARGEDDFAKGRSFAYYEVISLMQQQAVAFDLPLEDLKLEGLDPERDLLVG